MASAAEISGDSAHVHLLGISHRTAPIDILERLALSSDEIETFYQRAFADGRLRDAAVISTCNRTEIYALGASGHDAGAAVREILNQVAGPERVPPQSHTYDFRGRQGIEHLFRVASGLDSLILGEQQILGQVKDAFDSSRERRPPTPYFERLMQAALKVGKRSRSDTEIGKGAVSVASAAVHLSTRIFGDMTNRTVVVVGAGETGRLLAEHFGKLQPRRIVVLNRSLDKAERLATELGIEAASLDTLDVWLKEADVVATAIRTTTPLIAVDAVQRALAHTGRGPLALVDVGLPRNIAPEVNKLANVFHVDIDALRQVVDGNLQRRKKEIPRVEEIIAREVDGLLAWQATVQVGPLIAALREAVEVVRATEVAKVSPGLDAAGRDAVERATKAVVNKLLHGPMAAIRDMAKQQEEGAERLQLIRKLFSNLEIDDKPK